MDAAAQEATKSLNAFAEGVKQVLTVQLTIEEQAKDIIKRQQENEAVRREIAKQKGEDPDKDVKEKAIAKEQQKGQAAEAAGPFGSLSPTLAPAIGALGGAVGVAADALAAMPGKIEAAITAIPDAINSIVRAVKPFVAAFSPQAIVRLDVAMDNLSATVGYALEPVIRSVTQTIRNAAGALRPALDALRPAVEKISAAFGGSLSRYVAGVGQAFSYLEPYVSRFADASTGLSGAIDSVVAALRALNSAGTALYPIIGTALLNVFQGLVTGVRIFARWVEVGAISLQAFFETLAPLLGGITDNKTALDAMADAFDSAIRSVVLFAAQVAKFAGAETYLKNLVKAYKPKEDQGTSRIATPKDFSFGRGLEEVMKENTLRALASQGGPTRDDQRDAWLKGTYDELLKIQAGQASVPAKLAEIASKIDQIVQALPNPRAVQREAGRFLQGAGNPVAALLLNQLLG